MSLPIKIISGGQTGVDRAALDAALELNIECGGWCPKHRRAMDGMLPLKYPVKETPSPDYKQRTKWNVRDSDGTLIINREKLEGGTAYTIEVAKKMQKPYLVIDIDTSQNIQPVLDWLEQYHIQVLNVAGPREEKRQGIYAQTHSFLLTLFRSITS